MRRLLADPDGRADALLALAIWLVAALAYYGAAQLPPPLFDPLGSAAVPQAVAIILALLAAAILFRRWASVSRNPEPAAKPPGTAAVDPPLRLGIALAAVAVITAYVGVMALGWLGFREATAPFVLLLGGVLSRFRRGTMIVLVPLALAAAIGLAWIFSGPLYVDLPTTKWLPAGVP
jgi:putative tricarboxylic transport membrane protein